MYHAHFAGKELYFHLPGRLQICQLTITLLDSASWLLMLQRKEMLEDLA